MSVIHSGINIGRTFIHPIQGFVVLLVQAFYVYRIWQCKSPVVSLRECMLTWSLLPVSHKNIYIVALLAILLGAEFGSNTAFFVKMYVYGLALSIPMY